MNKGDLLATKPTTGRAMRFFATVPIMVTFFLLCLCVSVSNADERPNIVLILCDDLGYADVGFNGSSDIVTSNLDDLAANGTVFSSAYVCHPFCGPSRMGLMTGRYPHTFGAPFNLPNSGLGIEDFNQQGIPIEEELISTVLQDAGYFTGAIGKWHLGVQPKHHPNRRGFDDFYGFLGGGHMYFPEKYGPIYERQKRSGKANFNDYIAPLEHNGKQVQETEYMTDGLSREAVRFVKDASGKDEPFFLYLAYNAPHTPLEAKPEDFEKFDSIEDEKRRTYAAMVYAVDRGIGQVVEALQQTEELENTLIIFLSDNGGKMGAGSNNGPLQQGKGSVCEGGIRVPILFHWPSQVAAGKTYDHPVSALDFYPTLARIAEAKTATTKQLDGIDIWDAFQAGTNARQNQPIYALRHWNGFHNVGIRQNQWKALKRGPKAAWKLFNLNQDIGEKNDVSEQHPLMTERLVEAAKQWSRTHTQPLWFDNKKAEAAWQTHDMPMYESTFANPK
ncbi:MAG: sulfatase-like hydrolase/transferase [Fuerstiella sp.]